MRRVLRALTSSGLGLALLYAVGTSGSGCASYRVLEFDDHGGKAVTQLQTLRHTNYYMWSSSEHQFWMCRDEGDVLKCQRRCGGETDLACPSSTGTGVSIQSNVR